MSVTIKSDFDQKQIFIKILAEAATFRIPSNPIDTIERSVLLATEVNEENFLMVMVYLRRLPKDRQLLFFLLVRDEKRWIFETKNFNEWLAENHSLFRWDGVVDLAVAKDAP